MASVFQVQFLCAVLVPYSSCRTDLASVMSEGGVPDAPGDSRPAIIVRGLSTDTDDEFLKLYFSLHGGDVKCVALLKEDRQACVEFTDPSGKRCLFTRTIMLVVGHCGGKPK